MNGSPISIDDATEVLVHTIYNPKEEYSPQQAEKIGIDLLRLYCTNIAPTQHYVAVETYCERLEIIDLGIALTGTTDRIYCDSEDNYGIADIKTGKAAVKADGTVKTSGHAAQMAVYELLASQVMQQHMDAPAKIIGLQAAKTAKGQRAGIGVIENALDLLLGIGEQKGLLEQATSLLRSGLFYANPRSMMCSAKHCPIHPCCAWRK